METEYLKGKLDLMEQPRNESDAPSQEKAKRIGFKFFFKEHDGNEFHQFTFSGKFKVYITTIVFL